MDEPTTPARTRERDRRFAKLPMRELPGDLAVIEAQTHRSRRRGLSRLDRLDPCDGLLIPATPSVHTFGMRFALDLIWLDRRGMVVRVDRDVVPRRFRGCRRARAVIEVNGGRADAFLAFLGAVPGSDAAPEVPDAAAGTDS
jgi:uncharacterized membrane protein (UPF0127 family)